jgi:hypothetical protein
MDRKQLLIQDFIREHEDWETILPLPPYSVNISRDTVLGRNLVMLKYNMLEDPDFNNPMVRECRGLVLDADTFETVEVPFYKFGNYGESYCPEIDWKSSMTTQKIDGSLIKVVRFGKDILISTNGTIDAFKAPVPEQVGCRYSSFGEMASELFENIRDKNNLSWETMFEENVTYMFEMVSKWTRVVVPWETEGDLYFLGYRDNINLQEGFPFNHILSRYFKVPEIYNLSSLSECLDATSKLPWNEEGYVVVDSKFNRIKIKSPAYVAIHHMKGEGVFSTKNAIDLIKMNTADDYLSYFPEVTDKFMAVKDKFMGVVRKVDDFWKENEERIRSMETRKEQALTIISGLGELKAAGFSILDGKVKDGFEYFLQVPTKNLVEMFTDRKKTTNKENQ